MVKTSDRSYSYLKTNTESASIFMVQSLFSVKAKNSMDTSLEL